MKDKKTGLINECWVKEPPEYNYLYTSELIGQVVAKEYDQNGYWVVLVDRGVDTYSQIIRVGNSGYRITRSGEVFRITETLVK